MRFKHNLSHTVTATMNMGLVTPLVTLPAYPGDDFPITNKVLARTLPQVGPTMHDVRFSVDYHEVPWRQVFEKMGLNWDNFLTGGADGSDETLLPKVVVPASGWPEGSLADFLGYPANYIDPDTGSEVIVGAGLELSAMRVLCYIHVWNTYYRDQNFVEEIPLTVQNAQDLLDGNYDFKGLDGESLGYTLGQNGILPKAWRRDYFGRMLPNTQRGQEVRLPIEGNAPLNPTLAPIVSTTSVSGTNMLCILVISKPVPGDLPSSVRYNILGASGTTTVIPAGDILGPKIEFTLPSPWSFPSGSFDIGTVTFLELNGETTYKVTGTITKSSSKAYQLTSVTATLISGNPIEGFSFAPVASGVTSNSDMTETTVNQADLSGVVSNLQEASSVGIIAFRMAARMQHFGELLNFTGYRAVEFTLGFFGVKIPDDRAQWPIYHGGWSTPILFSEVLQTSNSTSSSPQGNLAGHGITGANKSLIDIKIKEHCYVFALAHIMPTPQYHTMVARDLLQSTRWDLPNPIFEFVGEQPVYSVELYPNASDPKEILGFVPRYSELSYLPSVLRGQMRSAFASWNMARMFSTQPVLSAAFRYEKPTDRTMAVKNEDEFQVDFAFICKAKRPFRGANSTAGIHIV